VVGGHIIRNYLRLEEVEESTKIDCESFISSREPELRCNISRNFSGEKVAPRKTIWPP
jgi:hypothetical protein